ncbi:MAG: hypothetical protein ACREQ7_12790, partial [Candidatus Binatia bacterium]
MSLSSRRIVVIEDDPFLRFLQVVLDPAAPADRVAAFSHFLAHDLPDLSGWCNRLRERIPKLYPAEVRFVKDEATLLVNLAGAQVFLVEDFAVGAREIAASAGTLEVVQKYGTITSRILQYPRRFRGGSGQYRSGPRTALIDAAGAVFYWHRINLKLALFNGVAAQEVKQGGNRPCAVPKRHMLHVRHQDQFCPRDQ